MHVEDFSDVLYRYFSEVFLPFAEYNAKLNTIARQAVRDTSGAFLLKLNTSRDEN